MGRLALASSVAGEINLIDVSSLDIEVVATPLPSVDALAFDDTGSFLIAGHRTRDRTLQTWDGYWDLVRVDVGDLSVALLSPRSLAEPKEVVIGRSGAVLYQGEVGFHVVAPDESEGRAVGASGVLSVSGSLVAFLECPDGPTSPCALAVESVATQHREVLEANTLSMSLLGFAPGEEALLVGRQAGAPGENTGEWQLVSYPVDGRAPIELSEASISRIYPPERLSGTSLFSPDDSRVLAFGDPRGGPVTEYALDGSPPRAVAGAPSQFAGFSARGDIIYGQEEFHVIPEPDEDVICCRSYVETSITQMSSSGSTTTFMHQTDERDFGKPYPPYQRPIVSPTGRYLGYPHTNTPDFFPIIDLETGETLGLKGYSGPLAFDAEDQAVLAVGQVGVELVCIGNEDDVSLKRLGVSPRAAWSYAP